MTFPVSNTHAFKANSFALEKRRVSVKHINLCILLTLKLYVYTKFNIYVNQACFFNHFAAMQVNGFSETLSLAENSLSLASKSSSLASKSSSLAKKSLS